MKESNETEETSAGIQVQCQGAVNVMRFNRMNKKNAITARMYQRLATAIGAAEANPAIRVHVFLGQPGVFTAGNDISDFIASATEQGGLGKEVLAFLHSVADTSKPMLAGVDGMAVGVGTTLLMHCDLVYATENALFVTPFTSLGLVPEAASSLLGPRLLGYPRAFALLAAGERFDATWARESGLINSVVEAADLEQTVMEMANQLAGRPADALVQTRRLMRGSPAEIKQRIDQEAEEFARLLVSEEAQRAFAAFMSR